ncbi:MAG: iron chelate uptake ABC transporter family permease subunit, partial [Candidatus Methanomethylophilaceae archaeon]|nr:iron chelate uptake ABC transporter family permease subunit [Candidatus Methanomethylophilaceae archaeon]
MGFEEFSDGYRKYLRRKILFIALCLSVGFIAFIGELGLGSYHMSFIESFQALWDHITGNVAGTEEALTRDEIVWSIRLPRAIAGAAVGAGLGVCGCAMQSSMKNPLADPYTTGISSGASFGAGLAIIMGFGVASYTGEL